MANASYATVLRLDSISCRGDLARGLQAADHLDSRRKTRLDQRFPGTPSVLIFILALETNLPANLTRCKSSRVNIAVGGLRVQSLDDLVEFTGCHPLCIRAAANICHRQLT